MSILEKAYQQNYAQNFHERACSPKLRNENRIFHAGPGTCFKRVDCPPKLDTTTSPLLVLCRRHGTEHPRKVCSVTTGNCRANIHCTTGNCDGHHPFSKPTNVLVHGVTDMCMLLHGMPGAPFTAVLGTWWRLARPTAPPHGTAPVHLEVPQSRIPPSTIHVL